MPVGPIRRRCSADAAISVARRRACVSAFTALTTYQMVARWYHGACFEYQAHAALFALNVLAWAAGNAVGRCS